MLQEHLDTAEAQQIIKSGEIFYSAGFFLTVSVPSLLKVTQHCVENNKIFCLNFAAPFIIDFFGDQVAAALPFADYVFCNESEAEAYGKKHSLGDEGKNLEEVALKVAAMPKASGTRSRTVVFTQGASCTIVAKEGVVTKYDVQALPAELLVDTNGAGDAFVGGFLSQLSKGKGIEACVKAGHWASRVIIQSDGCTFPKVCDYKGE